MERQQHTAIYTNLRILSTAAAETPNWFFCFWLFTLYKRLSATPFMFAPFIFYWRVHHFSRKLTICKRLKKDTFLVRFDIFVRFDILTVSTTPTFWICTFFFIFVWNRSVWMTFKSNWVWNTVGLTCLRIFDIYDFWSKKISKPHFSFKQMFKLID